MAVSCGTRAAEGAAADPVPAHLVLLQMLAGDWPRSLASRIMSRTAMPRHSSWASWLPGMGTRPLRKSLRHWGRVRGRGADEQGPPRGGVRHTG